MFMVEQNLIQRHWQQDRFCKPNLYIYLCLVTQALENHFYSRIYQELSKVFPHRNATLDKQKLLFMGPAAVAEVNINDTSITQLLLSQ